MDEEERTIKLRYGAASNITFHGTIETNITVSEWNEMTNDEQEQVTTNALYELVDIWDVTE